MGTSTSHQWRPIIIVLVQDPDVVSYRLKPNILILIPHVHSIIIFSFLFSIFQSFLLLKLMKTYYFYLLIVNIYIYILLNVIVLILFNKDKIMYYLKKCNTLTNLFLLTSMLFIFFFVFLYYHSLLLFVPFFLCLFLPRWWHFLCKCELQHCLFLCETFFHNVQFALPTFIITFLFIWHDVPKFYLWWLVVIFDPYRDLWIIHVGWLVEYYSPPDIFILRTGIVQDLESNRFCLDQELSRSRQIGPIVVSL